MRNVRFFLPVLGLCTLLSASGCEKALNTMTDSPEFRKGVVEKGRASCLTSANAAVPGTKTPEMQSRIAGYCDCVATKGLATLSNADLIEIGVKGVDSASPAQKAKMDGMVKMCIAEAFPK